MAVNSSDAPQQHCATRTDCATAACRAPERDETTQQRCVRASSAIKEAAPRAPARPVARGPQPRVFSFCGRGHPRGVPNKGPHSRSVLCRSSVEPKLWKNGSTSAHAEHIVALQMTPCMREKYGKFTGTRDGPVRKAVAPGPRGLPRTVHLPRGNTERSPSSWDLSRRTLHGAAPTQAHSKAKSHIRALARIPHPGSASNSRATRSSEQLALAATSERPRHRVTGACLKK